MHDIQVQGFEMEAEFDFFILDSQTGKQRPRQIPKPQTRIKLATHSDLKVPI